MAVAKSAKTKKTASKTKKAKQAKQDLLDDSSWLDSEEIQELFEQGKIDGSLSLAEIQKSFKLVADKYHLDADESNLEELMELLASEGVVIDDSVVDEEDDEDWGAVPAFLRRSKLK